MKKRVLAWFLAAVVLGSSINVSAYAQGTDAAAVVEETAAQSQQETAVAEETEPETATEAEAKETESESESTAELPETETVPETEVVPETETEAAEQPERAEASSRERQIDVGLDEEFTIENAGDQIILKYTPSESGEYSMWTIGADSPIRLRGGTLYAYGWNDGYNDTLRRMHLDAGTTYTYMIWYLDESVTGSMKVRFEKNVPVINEELEIGSNKSYTIPEPNQYVELSYTPTESGEYNFWSHNSDYPIGVELREAEGEYLVGDVYSKEEILINYQLEAGKTYLYRVYMSDGKTGSFWAAFEKKNPKEVKKIELSAYSDSWWDVQSLVYPFDTVSVTDASCAQGTKMKITYADGGTWVAAANTAEDLWGNQYYYNVEREAANPRSVKVSVGVYDQDNVRGECQLNFTAVDQVQYQTLSEGMNTGTITDKWKYYYFEAAEAGTFQFEISNMEDIIFLNSQFCDQDFKNLSSIDGRANMIYAGKGCYLRLRQTFAGGETFRINIRRTKDIEKITAQTDGREFKIGQDTYRDAASAVSLKILYTDGQSEVLPYDEAANGWNSAVLGYLGYQGWNGGVMYDSDPLMEKKNRIDVYFGSTWGERDPGEARLTSVEIDAGALADHELETIHVNEEKRVAGKRTLFWFTPTEAKEYHNQNNWSWVDFYGVEKDGTLWRSDSYLTAGQKYLVIASLNEPYDPVDIALVARDKIVTRETVTVGLDKSYQFTEDGEMLELVFTPEKNRDFEMVSYGQAYVTAALIDPATGKVLRNSDSLNSFNFRLSVSLEKGKTYLYRIQYSSYGMSEKSRITLRERPHTHTYEWITVPATCGKAGNRYQQCSACGESGTKETIPATGKHSYGSYIVTKQPTCAAAGQRHRVCRECGYKTAAERVPATGKHSYGPYQTTKEPTAVAEGSKTRTCKTCGRKETLKIPKLKGFVKLNFKGTLKMKVKQSTTAVKVTMEKGDRIASWKSSKSKIVSVSKSGKLKAKKTGKAKITVTLKSGAKKSFTVKVGKKKVTTASLKLDQRTLTLKKGKRVQLQAAVQPITSQDKVKFTTSNKKVATVSSKGLVRARKKGKATITARSGKKTVRCKIIVK